MEYFFNINGVIFINTWGFFPQIVFYYIQGLWAI